MAHNYEAARQRLHTVLLRWQSGELNERQAHQEAESVWTRYSPWPELPEVDAGSVLAETAQLLDALNAHWVTVEDVPSILRLLNTPSGEEIRAWSEWRAYWDHIDFSSRKQQLESNPYYLKSPNTA